MIDGGQVMAWIGGRARESGGFKKLRFSGVSTDTRSLKAGELFVALQGVRFDGHDYLDRAVEQGAAGAVVSTKWKAPEGSALATVSVLDTLVALGSLARGFRDRFEIPLVGVTGSNGKTTVKEMVADCLASKRKVIRNRGNMNNRIGLPLSLFQLGEGDEVGVFELGMNIPGEVGILADILRPAAGIVTNTAPVHLEFMKDLATIRRSKLELLDHLSGADPVALVNGDDPELVAGAADRDVRLVTFGLGPGCRVRGRRLHNQGGYYSFTVEAGPPISLSVPGVHNVYNALAALAASAEFGVSYEESSEVLSGFSGLSMRFEVDEVAGVMLIDDSYNANPTSLATAVKCLNEFLAGRSFAGRRVAAVGDMLELGDQAASIHRAAGVQLVELGIDHLTAVGELGVHLVRGAREKGLDMSESENFGTIDDAVDFLSEYLRSGDVVLVKGSRGMAMDGLVRGLKENLKKG
jgi:UDP-N-acetylmuramoyl-tripeptide--D-alanyl-D-alanine ligase